MKQLSNKVISRIEKHEMHAIGILNTSVKGQEQRARDRFDWSGNEQIKVKQNYTENEYMKLQKRLDTLYRYENEGPVAPMVEEEKDLNDKQMSKIRKERESEISNNQKTITTAHKVLLKNPPEIPELTHEDIIDKLFKNPYTYEVAHEFSPEAVRDNFIETVKKLDEIIRIANAIKENPSLAEAYAVIDDEDYKLTISYDFETFAFACQKEFDNSLAVNGLKYENGQLKTISYEKTQEASANSQKVRQNVINVFKKADYLDEKNTVQSFVDNIIEDWSVEDYFECVDNTELSETLKQMHNAMQQNNNATIGYLYDDYLRFANSIMANAEAGQLLRQEKDSPTEGGVFDRENYDFAGHIQDKINEIDEYIAKTEREMSFVKKLFDAMVNKETLSTKQRLYLKEYYLVDDQELVNLFVNKLNSYKYIQLEYSNAESYSDKLSLDTNKQKIEELCPKLKPNMSTDELLELSEDLYKVAAAIKRRFDQYIKTPSLKLKSQKIIVYAQKARALTLYHASGWYNMIENTLTDGEKEYIVNTFGSIDYESVAKYAKVSYVEADATYTNIRRECVNHPEIWKKLGEIKESVKQDTYVSHRNADKEIQKIKEDYGNKETSLYNIFWSYYDLTDINKDLFKKMKEKLDKASNSDAKKSETDGEKITYSATKETLTNKAIYSQTLSRLGGDTYKIFGNEQEIPFSLDTLNNLPGISDMEDEEYEDLLEKLRAGTFYVPPVNAVEEPSNAKEDEEFLRLLSARTSYKRPSSIAALKAKECFENDVLKGEVKDYFVEENKDGLQIIKDKMSEYFDSLYDKYGLDIPALEQIMDNPRDIVKDFSYCKECFKFVNCDAIFDENNSKDMMLKNKIKFYGEMVNCFNKAVQLAKEGGVYLGKIDIEIKRMWDNNMKSAAEYIKNNN